MTTPSKILCRRKREYERKFITPLVSKFTKPPKMYDDGQIRLKKQIEFMMDVLDHATLCKKCGGACAIFDKIEHVQEVTWKDEIDPREYTSCICKECQGQGLEFPKID